MVLSFLFLWNRSGPGFLLSAVFTLSLIFFFCQTQVILYGEPLAYRKNNFVDPFRDLLPLGHFALFFLPLFYFPVQLLFNLCTLLSSRSLSSCWTRSLSLQKELFAYRKSIFAGSLCFYWSTWTFKLPSAWLLLYCSSLGIYLLVLLKIKFRVFFLGTLLFTYDIQEGKREITSYVMLRC